MSCAGRTRHADKDSHHTESMCQMSRRSPMGLPSVVRKVGRRALGKTVIEACSAHKTNATRAGPRSQVYRGRASVFEFRRNAQGASADDAHAHMERSPTSAQIHPLIVFEERPLRTTHCSPPATPAGARTRLECPSSTLRQHGAARPAAAMPFASCMRSPVEPLWRPTASAMGTGGSTSGRSCEVVREERENNCKRERRTG